MIHGHGDDLYRSEGQIKANFSTNVWYEADTAALCRFLQSKLDHIFHYPEPDAGSFVKVAAAYHGLLPENVLAGNGATELFYLIAHAFAGSSTLLPIPSFQEYQDACALYDHRLTFMEDFDPDRLPDQANLMFICNPNNPDGKVWTEEEIRFLLERYPEMFLVIDESFVWFAPEIHSADRLLKEYPNLLVVRSMTKCYAIPGLRLGYLLGDPSLIEYIRCFSQPWSVNALAIEAGKFLLQHGESGLPDSRALLRRQQAFADAIARIPGFRPRPSHTSFFLVETDYRAAELKEYLLAAHGLLIRDASNFKGLNSHYFRVNTLTEEKNALLIEGLKQYLNKS